MNRVLVVGEDSRYILCYLRSNSKFRNAPFSFEWVKALDGLPSDKPLAIVLDGVESSCLQRVSQLNVHVVSLQLEAGSARVEKDNVHIVPQKQLTSLPDLLLELAKAPKMQPATYEDD